MRNAAMIGLAGCIFAGCILAGCSSRSRGPYKIENVTRVFYGARYSVMTEDPKTKEVDVIDCGCDVRIIADAPAGKPMWVDVDKKYTIHIHSAKDVDGGRTGDKYSHRINVIE